MSASHPKAGSRLARWQSVPGHPGVHFVPYADGKGSVKRHRAPYGVKYRDSAGKQVGPSGSYASVEEAEAALRQVGVRRDTGRQVVHSREPFEQFAAQWLADAGDPNGENPLCTRSVQLYEQMLRLWVNPVIGRRPICEIDVDDVKAVVAKMKEAGKSTGYIENAFKPMRGTLNRAVARHILGHNPVSLLERNERPKTSRKGYRVLAPSELERLFEAAASVEPARSKLYTALVGVGLLAGLRIGEVLGLIWSDVDFDRGILRVERQYPQKTGHVASETLPLPKYGRRRVVKLGTRLARILREQYMAAGRPEPSEYVFLSGRGRVYTAEAVRKILGRLITAAEIESKVEGRVYDLSPDASFTYHSLRHTYASALIHAGLSDFEVATQLGHRDASTTRKYYVHLFHELEQFDRAGAALDSAFGA